MFAMLGDVRFELLSSFTDFEETHTAAYAKHEVLAGRPRLQAMGNELTEIRFSLRLHWRLGNPDTAYRGLIEAKEAQEALALVYGSGRHAGWFVISSISSRTLIQDAKGRTAARELDVQLTEFVGDPNNPLPTPGVAAGKNPLLSMLPESVQGAASKVAAAVETGVRIYNEVEQGIEQVQTLITQAQALKNNPLTLFGLAGDALAAGSGMLGKLNRLPEIGAWFGDLAGAADFLAYSGQAARQLSSGVAALQGGIASGSVGGWLDAAAGFVASAGDSLSNAAAGAQSLTAWLAMRKDGAA